MPQIYALTHVPPEVSAYGMAKYSRSSQSMRESLVELSQQKAEAFLNTFYFSYGHASIADLAHVPLAMEDVSLLAAMEIVDEPLWDGQERSTRYQDFNQSPYHVPQNASESFSELTEHLFTGYRRLFDESSEALRLRYPQPEGMKSGLYQRTLKARAFDLARYYLPLSTLTSLGQVTNARVLEQQIRRLMASPHAEVRQIAAGMKAAVTTEPPFNLILERLERAGVPLSDQIRQELESAPVAPTLTKYTEADAYRIALRELVAPIVRQHFTGVSPSVSPVVVHNLGDLLDDQVAGLIYGGSSLSYQDISIRLASMSRVEKEEIWEAAMGLRGPHDAWPTAFQQRPLMVDVTVDVGAFRDLNRHRRLDKVVQPLNPAMGFEVPEELRDLGVGSKYVEDMSAHYQRLNRESPEAQPYLLPLAHKRRVLLRMDLAEAAYLVELRSRSSGHFSYRRIAVAIYEAVTRAFPYTAQHIRVTSMEDFDPFER